MQLFDTLPIQNTNLLPFDGTVNYHGAIMSDHEARQYLKILQESIAWKNDELVIFGKKITTQREVAWYGNSAFSYTYSNATKQAQLWTDELFELKTLVENHAKTSFNSCLLNLYHDGSQGMGWHSDDEKSLQKHGAIASLSLGAERKFSFRHKQNKESKIGRAHV